jgi:hypothetical protein
VIHFMDDGVDLLQPGARDFIGRITVPLRKLSEQHPINQEMNIYDERG